MGIYLARRYMLIPFKNRVELNWARDGRINLWERFGLALSEGCKLICNLFNSHKILMTVRFNPLALSDSPHLEA